MRIYNPTTASGGGSGETGATGATGETGPLPWILMGEYNNGYSYNMGQAVTYQGGFYYRTGNPLNPGYPPTPGAINASWTPVADRGEQGATGPQGPEGQSSSFFNYQAKVNNSFPPTTPINNGHVKWNTPTQINATEIAFSHIDYNGNDIDIFFTLYKQNDTFVIQDQSNSDNYQKWRINGTPIIVDNNYLILPVSLVSSGGTSQFSDNQRVIFAITSLGLQGATGPSGIQGATVATGLTLTNIPANTQSSSYTLASSDAGKYVSISSGGVTVPSGIFNSGDIISVYNDSNANQTITQGSLVTMYIAGTNTTGNRTLAQRGIATILCVGSNTFVITGGGIA